MSILDNSYVTAFDMLTYHNDILLFTVTLTPNAVQHDEIWLGASIMQLDGTVKDFSPMLLARKTLIALWNEDYTAGFALSKTDLAKYTGTMVVKVWANKPSPNTVGLRCLAETSISLTNLAASASEDLAHQVFQDTPQQVIQDASNSVTNVTTTIERTTETIKDLSGYLPYILIGFGLIYVMSVSKK